MAAITLQITIGTAVCKGGGHFGADVDFNGRQYRVCPISRTAPTDDKVQEMLAVLVAAITADLATHADVIKEISADLITIRPDTEVTP